MTSDIVQFDQKWGEFLDNLHSLPINSSYEQACEATGIGLEYFKKVVDLAIAKWRDSTTTSILNGIANLKIGEVPQGDVFSDLVWQTRFLLVARMGKIISVLDVKPIRKDGKPFMVKNEVALTVNNIGEFVVNKIIRALFLYWYINHKKQVKLPKRIYRGIRASDLFNHDNFKVATDAIYSSDQSYQMKRKQVIDILIKWICDKRLPDLIDAKLLSFTSNVNVAKYFSNGTGFCLSVDPTKVEIIASEVHDEENIGGVDFVSNKKEHEFIIRIPDDYEFKPEDIIINDLDYFIAEENPLCVSLLDHDDKLATYTMHGKNIEVYFHWRNDNYGSLLFSCSNNFGLSRKEFQKLYGFDPLPNPKNLGDITNFKISKRKNY